MRSLIACLCLFCLPALPTTGLQGAPTKERITNSIGMTLVRIEPGSFRMGSSGESLPPDVASFSGRSKGKTRQIEISRHGDPDEQPAHVVRISKPFHMATTEVTNAEFERFDPTHRKLRGKLGFSIEDDEAVVFVSWRDAVRFCDWLSRKEKRSYRLPTEAEWEYACRAGSTTVFNTGDSLPEAQQKHQGSRDAPIVVELAVARQSPNAWGLHDMHGNVEEWCQDRYGPYASDLETDPVGRESGDFRVTRGGSHGTPIYYLRSANRQGSLPDDRQWLTGFRVVLGEPPATRRLPAATPRRWARDVRQIDHDWRDGPDSSMPYFHGPEEFVKIPPDSNGPYFSKHNHQPDITGCPNGDLIAIWYSCRRERGRELTVLASRLRRGASEWEAADTFWDTPDRNDHANAIWWDGKETLYHFNGLSTDAGWKNLALIMRTSRDSGHSWSEARLIVPEHSRRNMPISGVIQTREGHIVLPCDSGTRPAGSVVHISRDRGETWYDPGLGRVQPNFADGSMGAWIAGIHAGVAQLENGDLLALGRGSDIDERMPMSVSRDMGRNWTFSASEFPRISGGQRLVLLRLREGPVLLVSFTDHSKRRDKPVGLEVRDAAGQSRRIFGMFATLLGDPEKKHEAVVKPVTPGGPGRQLDGGAWTDAFTMDETHAEPMGYLAATQTPDGVIHLISSKLHYRFNLAWLRTPMPADSH